MQLCNLAISFNQLQPILWEGAEGAGAQIGARVPWPPLRTATDNSLILVNQMYISTSEVPCTIKKTITAATCGPPGTRISLIQITDYHKTKCIRW